MLLLVPIILNSFAAVSAEIPDLRIIGGEPVNIRDRPFQILIYRNIIGFLPSCGGSIIHHRWILTAAHCVNGTSAEDLLIRVGVDDLNDKLPMVFYNIRKSIPHQRFNGVPQAMTNDIALLMTDTDIIYGPTVQPIPVRANTPEANSEAVVSGFGTTKVGVFGMSPILAQVSVNVLGWKSCKRILSDITQRLYLSKGHFCAAHMPGGRDACQGDSGGPITIGGFLAGIVSWGIGCAHQDMPAFYTDVSKFIPWICETIQTNSGYSLKYCRAHGYRDEK